MQANSQLQENDSDLVMEYLRNRPNDYIAAAEISWKADDVARFAREKNWAVPVLLKLLAYNLVESNGYGKYRLKMLRIRA